MSGVTTSRMRKREQKMKRIMWANPMIKSAGYDAQQQMLEIEFANNGQIWHEECRKWGREPRHTGNTNRGMKL